VGWEFFLDAVLWSTGTVHITKKCLFFFFFFLFTLFFEVEGGGRWGGELRFTFFALSFLSCIIAGSDRCSRQIG